VGRSYCSASSSYRLSGPCAHLLYIEGALFGVHVCLRVVCTLVGQCSHVRLGKDDTDPERKWVLYFIRTRRKDFHQRIRRLFVGCMPTACGNYVLSQAQPTVWDFRKVTVWFRFYVGSAFQANPIGHLRGHCSPSHGVVTPTFPGRVASFPTASLLSASLLTPFDTLVLDGFPPTVFIEQQTLLSCTKI
jgi:hypothetical protein